MRSRQRFQPLLLLLNAPERYARRFGIELGPQGLVGLRACAAVFRLIICLGPGMEAVSDGWHEGETAESLVERLVSIYPGRISQGDHLVSLWLAGQAGDGSSKKAFQAWEHGMRDRSNPREMVIARRVALSSLALEILRIYADLFKEILPHLPSHISASDMFRALGETSRAAIKSGALDPLQGVLGQDLLLLPILTCRLCPKVFLRGTSKHAQRYCPGCRRRWTPKQRWSRTRSKRHSNLTGGAHDG